MTALSDLEARYDGPIPKHLRDAAMDRPAPGTREASARAWASARRWYRRWRGALTTKDAYWSRHWFMSAVARWAECRSKESSGLGNSVGALGWQTFSNTVKRRMENPVEPEPTRRAA